jgi:hypothetical protein
MPYMANMPDMLCESRYFTNMDLTSGYYQLRICLDEHHKILIFMPDSLYEQKALPFVLPNVPSAFMRTTHRVVEQHRKYTVVYLDNIMVYS